jgi:hypothetical protein
MKTRLVIVAVVLGVLCVTARLFAEESRTVAIYRDYIDKKIEQCERKAAQMNSPWEHIKHSATLARKQVNFFVTHKDLLVKEMLQEGIGANPQRANYFLIDRFRVHLAEQEQAAIKVSERK